MHPTQTGDAIAVPRGRDLSLDALKGLAILMVLVLHIGPVRFEVPGGTWGVAGPGHGVLGASLAALLAFTYRELLQLAVPVFLLISLSLYVSRAAVRPGYVWKRVLRLGELLGFWLGVQWLLAAAIQGGWPQLSWHALRLGGPSLQSGAPGTVLYFLVDLIALIVLAEAALGVTSWLGERAGRVIAWGLVIAPLTWFVAAPLLGVRPEYWDIGNFVPYVGVALLLGGDLRRLVPARFALGMAAAALFAAEIVTVAAEPGLTMDLLPDYARPGIVLGALALVAFALEYLPPARALVLLGEYSLGVFTLHALVQFGVNRLVPGWRLAGSVGVVQVNLVSGALVIVLTLAAVWLLSRTPLRRFVR